MRASLLRGSVVIKPVCLLLAGDCADNLDAYELKQSLQRNRDLIQHSQPIIDFLFEQVKHSQKHGDFGGCAGRLNAHGWRS